MVTGQVVCNGNRETLARVLAKDSVIRWHFQSFARKRRVMRDMQAGRTPLEMVVFRRPRALEAWLAGVATAPAGPKASEPSAPLRA
jgi:hypothetical protein